MKLEFDVITIGGGRTGLAAAMDAINAGKTCALISYGRSTHNVDYAPFTAAGGTLLMGDKAVCADIRPADSISGENLAVCGIRTLNLGDTLLVADEYIYAPGKFFGGGLVADMDKIYEPLFGLDVSYVKDMSEWFDPDFCKAQPFMDFGVVTDDGGHPFKDGRAIVNLTAKGEILCRKKA